MTVFKSTNTNPDYPAIVNGVTKEFLVGKYDGRRAYYVGCPKIGLQSVLNEAGGDLTTGARSWAFVGKQVDARGRVVYSEPSYLFDRVNTTGEKVKWDLRCAGADFGSLGYGVGATAFTSGSGTSATLPVRAPHGIQPGDTLYYYQVIAGGTPVNYGEIFDYRVHEMLSVRVESVRGANIVIERSISFTTNQRFVANKTLLMLRTKLGGTISSLYLAAEVPYPDFVFATGLTNIGVFQVYDGIADSLMFEPFALPEVGFEATRTRAGSAMTIHGGRLCVAREGNVYWSNPEAGRSSIEQTPLTNSINIGGTQGGAITSLCSTGDESLHVFRRAGVYRVSGSFINENGIPDLQQSTLIEGDLGAANSKATLSYGGYILAFGSGTVYAVRDGVISSDVGRPITEKLRGVSSGWRGYFYPDVTQRQIRLHCIRKTDDDKVFPNEVQYFTLDLKHADSETSESDNPTFAKSLFSGSWFRWAWKIGEPTNAGIISNEKEYYISQRAPYAPYSSTNQPLATQRREYQPVSGLWVRELETSSNKYLDGGKPVRNVINFTPIHKGQLDQEKSWVTLKFFRLLSESDLKRVTPWQSSVLLHFGLSNNLLTLDQNLLSLLSEVGFANIEDTQAICPLSGQNSPALEIEVTVDELYRSIGFSSVVLDHFEPFDIESQVITSED